MHKEAGYCVPYPNRGQEKEERPFLLFPMVRSRSAPISSFSVSHVRDRERGILPSPISFPPPFPPLLIHKREARRRLRSIFLEMLLLLPHFFTFSLGGLRGKPSFLRAPPLYSLLSLDPSLSSSLSALLFSPPLDDGGVHAVYFHLKEASRNEACLFLSLPPHYLTQNNALSFLDIKDQDSPKGEQASAPATMRPGKTIKKVFWMTNIISFTGENHARAYVLPKWVASL